MLDFLGWLSPMYFSKPGLASPVPLPTPPGEDPASKTAVADAARAAAVDAAQSGRRSTIYAGKTLTDEDFLGTGTSRGTPKKRGASDQLGVM